MNLDFISKTNSNDEDVQIHL